MAYISMQMLKSQYTQGLASQTILGGKIGTVIYPFVAAQ
jgi:hypothetical protein